MAYSAANAIAFCTRQHGRYSDGECWTLVEDAITGNGGCSSRGLTPNFSRNASFVWGTVVQLNMIQAGDILQFHNYRWFREITVDVTNPDESGGVTGSTQEEVRGDPQHSVMVVSVVSPGIVQIVEQNTPANTGGVQTVELVLVAPADRVVTVRTAVAGGDRVTITTTTDTVTNPPQCYRPISV